MEKQTEMTKRGLMREHVSKIFTAKFAKKAQRTPSFLQKQESPETKRRIGDCGSLPAMTSLTFCELCAKSLRPLRLNFLTLKMARADGVGRLTTHYSLLTTHYPRLTSHISHLTTHLLRSYALTVFFLLFLASATLTAQTVKLDYNDEKNKETVRVQLFDSYNGDFLMELPLTFHVTEDYVLFVIIGDETGIKKNTAICLFDETMELNDLTKKNRNFTFSDNFKKYHKKIYPFFERTNNVEMMMPFQNHCEYIETTPKPLFFQIKNKANSIDLKLRFYLADISNKEKSGLKLIAESGTIKTTINIIK